MIWFRLGSLGFESLSGGFIVYNDFGGGDPGYQPALNFNLIRVYSPSER